MHTKFEVVASTVAEISRGSQIVLDVSLIVRLVLARMIRRFSILAGVGHVFTFRVAFLLLRMEFMHSSFSHTGSRFFDRGLLLGIVLLAILVRMSVKCSMGSSRSLE